MGRTRGRITSYEMRFRPGVRDAEALVAVSQEVPSDAGVLFDVTKSACRKIQFQSHTKASVFGDAGTVFVELQGPDDFTYDRSHVVDAFFQRLPPQGPNDIPC